MKTHCETVMGGGVYQAAPSSGDGEGFQDPSIYELRGSSAMTSGVLSINRKGRRVFAEDERITRKPLSLCKKLAFLCLDFYGVNHRSITSKF